MATVHIRNIDDFVAAEEPHIMAIFEKEGQLVYSTLRGQQVLVRPEKE